MWPPLLKFILPEVLPNEELPTWVRRLLLTVVQLRVIVGISGSVFMWNGLYNALYYIAPEAEVMGWLGEDDLNNARLIKLLSCLVVGLLLVCVTGTLLPVSGVPHVLSDAALTPQWGSPCKVGRAMHAAIASDTCVFR